MKQEAQANFAAMSRDHVTEEDIEMFTHVQELAVQVRKLGNRLNILNIYWNFNFIFNIFMFNKGVDMGNTKICTGTRSFNYISKGLHLIGTGI